MYKFSEKEIENIIIDNLETIEPKLRLLRRQYNFAQRGRIDLLCLDRHNNLVIIEIKTYARPGSIYQLLKYPELLIQRFPKYNKKFRLILCFLKGSLETRDLCILNGVLPLKFKYSSLFIAKKKLELKLKVDLDYDMNLFMESHNLSKQFFSDKH